MLQVDTVGNVTKPVTQVDVVAVNNASMYSTASPVLELIGNDNNIEPNNITDKKLNKSICVVDNEIFRRFNKTSPYFLLHSD